MLSACWKRHLLNTNILIHDESNGSSMIYTYFPYEATKCDQVHPIVWNSFSRGRFLQNKDIFPEKLQNLNECPIYFQTSHIPPYMVLKPSTRNHSDYDVDGIEGVLLMQLERIINFTAVIKKVKFKLLNTNIDYLKMVKKSDSNVTIGCMLTQFDFRNDFSLTFPYYHTHLVFINWPKLRYSALEKLFMPFELPVWLMLLLLYITVFKIILLLMCFPEVRYYIMGSTNRSIAMDFLNILLGNAIARIHQRISIRTIFGFLMLGTLVLRSSYQGSLFRFLQSQKTSHDIDTLEELIEIEYPVFTYPVLIQMLTEYVPNAWKMYFIIDILSNIRNDTMVITF